MIDIHTHILPGIDDGSSSMEESLEMARHAEREGIHTIIATPHHANGKYTNDASAIDEAVHALGAELKRHHIAVQVLPGQEVRLYDQLIDDLQRGIIRTLADSPYILLELPSHKIPDSLEDMIHELLLRGYTPVIAHPERNHEVISKPEKLVPYIEQGALSQLTFHSVAGHVGRKVRKCALKLCKLNAVHFMASDAHNTKGRNCMLNEAYDVIRKKIGQDAVDDYKKNAEHLIRQKPIRGGNEWNSI